MKLQKIASLNPAKNYELIGEIAISTRSEIDLKIAQVTSCSTRLGIAWSQKVLRLENLYQLLLKEKMR